MSSAAKIADLFQWIAVSEDRLLLHDGLVCVADLVEVPNGVTELGEDDYELPVLDGKTPTELATIIQKECSTKNTAYASLIEYRRSALKGLWRALKESQSKRASSASEMNTISQSSNTQAGSFASRISLILIFPMLKSLSVVDPGLSSETAHILLESLRACEPLTLSSEPQECISGLESMLRSWLASAQEGAGDASLVQNAASALVALGVAVGTGSLLLRTVHMLQSLETTYPELNLLVPGILDKLLQERDNQEESSTLTADVHFLCWSYDDGLVQSTEKEGSGSRSIAFNGQFVYVTSLSLKHLLKMGTGKRGTIRGYVYASREIAPGWVLLVGRQLLLFQLREEGGEEIITCTRLDTDTLELCGGVQMVEGVSEQLHTVQILSDGSFVYWLYALKSTETIPHPLSSEKLKQHPVYVQALKMEYPESDSDDQPTLVPHGERKYIFRTIADIEKNPDVMKALLRNNPSHATGNASALASLVAQSKDDSTPLTSMGLSIHTIRRSTAYTTGSSLVLLCAPSSSGSGRAGLFGAQSHSSKALCYNFCYSLHTGKLVSQADLQSTSQLHCALTRGAGLANMAACYDPRNLCVWTTNDDWIDVWNCAGKVKVSSHHLDERLGKLERNSDPQLEQNEDNSHTLCITSAISFLLRHIGVESCRLVPGLEFPNLVLHSLPLSFLSQCCDLLGSSVAVESWGNVQVIIVTLQAVLPAFISNPSFTEEQLSPLKERVWSLVWALLLNKDCPAPLLTEVHRIISRNAEILFLTDPESPTFINILLEADSRSPELVTLRDELLTNLVSSMQTSITPSPAHISVMPLLRESVLTNSIDPLRKCFQLPEDQLSTLAALSPVMTPSLHCASMLMSLSLRRVTFALQETDKKESKASDSVQDDDELTIELDAAREALLGLCKDMRLFASCEATLQELIKLAATLPSAQESPSETTTEEEEQSTHIQFRLSAIDRVLKSSALGCVLQPLLVVISDPSVCTLQMANALQRQLSSLAQLTAQSCGLLYGSESLEVRVPSPWATGRTIETIHPVRDTYKYKETVTFPGAKNLYLKFDARSSSQYDYDKVIVYAGDTPSCPKVAEYGGNTHGFGSRSVLGKGWPKDLVKIEGYSVTLTFEMKSGREHSTPDKAMWGFACTVRPQESADDTASGLPFVTDLYLSLISVCCSLIGRLYSGPHPNEDERKCKDLLKYPLLHKCQWPVEQGSPDNLPLDSKAFPFFTPSPREPLPLIVVDKLRTAGIKPRPLLRPSHQELICPQTLEELIVTVCLKQHGLGSPLQILGQKSCLDTHTALLEAIFTRINGLERRLQALAELEGNWWHDVEDMCHSDKATTSEAFFFSLLQNESSLKSFELLCVLKKIEANHGDLVSTAQQLQDLLELDVERRRAGSGEPLDYTPVTRTLVKGIQERVQLLLNITISHTEGSASVKEGGGMAKEDLLSSGSTYTRSISAPPSTVDVSIRRQRSWGPKSANKLALLDMAISADQSSLLDQIFQFIGSKPEEAASCDSFLSAASQHWRRGVCRVRALGHLQQLLSSDYVGLAVEQLLASVGVVLQKGPGVQDIACGGMGERVREVFGSVMRAVVELASKQPASCINTIAMLCIVPFTRLEEDCLVRSGLVKLLDHLCSLVDTNKPLDVGGAADESIHRVTSLSWASFQVLAEQCVSWENQDTTLSSGLAQQVSHLLTNHLSRAMDRLVVSEGGASESLQDALSLLLGLAKSQMGRAILSQPACVSKLLLLLTDQRPSPKLVLIALQLCRIALPLMSMADCSQVEVPPHLLTTELTSEGGKTGSGVAGQIVGLFLSKLAEYIVPDSSQVSNKAVTDDSGSLEEAEHLSQGPTHKEDEFEQESGQASVYVYKRENENAADILQPLISQDPRQFRLSGGDRMQQVMAMDRALTQNGVAEVLTDSYRSCVRRSLRWANMGFTVSVGPPSVGTGEVAGSGVDKKKAKSELAARKKNVELLKTDPTRPFVSGHVAYSLASEVIGLLNGLLTEPGAAEVWGKAIKSSMLQSLVSVPLLSPKIASYTESVSNTVSKGGTPSPPGDLLSSACIANATFAALGGFKESIRPGLKVQVVGEGLEGSNGVIQSISERRGLANVQFGDDELCFGANKTLEVPISRLLPPHKDTIPLEQLGLQKELCKAIMSLLDTITPSPTHASTNADANTSPLGLCRLFAEIRTRACVALSHHVQDPKFAQVFLGESDNNKMCLEKLSEQARSSSPGVRLSLVEQHCHGLRMLYRDCSRPAAPRVERVRREPKQFKLDVTRVWPPVTSCSFTHNLMCVTYQGPSGFTPHAPANLSSGDTPATGQPKGVVIYTNMAIPSQAPSFYWELEVAHLGESSADTAHVAMGYSPSPGDGGGEQWLYPVGSCFIRSSGRACQVTGDNSMEWNTFRLDSPLKTGDVVGCGWVQGEEGGISTVYFTLNGERQGTEFNDAPPNMFPFLHVQKKAVRMRANLGERAFLYAGGSIHREAANIQEDSESAETVLAHFGALPFSVGVSDSEGEKEGEEVTKVAGGASVVELSHTGPPTRKLKPPIATVGYDHEASQAYQPTSSFDTMLESGPLVRPGGGVVESEDVEEEEGPSTAGEEDLHALLVKAWEAKVFPVIQRRFRNDQERKSGLEQIKGALQLGMESIAQETVEFLYEENGGIPKDLRLPTMDDVKAELGKFTISRIRKGSAVVVQKELPCLRCGVRAMQKTQGLTGIVLDVDHSNEIIQIECYLQNEGALVRFWYPVVYLERPPPGYRKSPALRGADAANMLVHRELLQCERSLASLYCRRALLRVKHVLDDSREEVVNHLCLVNAECFAEPLSDGLSTTTSPDLAPSPTAALHTLALSPMHTFYSDVDRMHTELQQAIQMSADLVALSQDLCDCLQRAPQSFSSSELKVTESKEAFDVTYPDAAFMLVSCVNDGSATLRPPSSTYKYPWARILCYRGGQGKGGIQQMQEVARYPNEMVQLSSTQYCGPTYPSLMLPFSRIHVKLGGCNTRPGKSLNILALPAGVPLALAFSEILSKHAVNLYNKDKGSNHIMDCGKALCVCLEGLCKVVARLSCPQLLKILLLHQLTDILWTLCYIFNSDVKSKKPQMYCFPGEFLQSIRQELIKVFENETIKFQGKNKPSVFPPAGSVASDGSGKFSTYFQAIFEFVLSAAKYQEHFHSVELLPTMSPATSLIVSPPSVTRSTSSEARPTDSTSSAAPPSIAELTKKPSKKSRSRRSSKRDSQSDSSSKKKEDWLSSVHTSASLLRSVVLEPSSSPVSHEASLSCQWKSKPTSRLVIVTGIDQRLNVENVQKGIQKLCSMYGGLYRDQLYLPTEEVSEDVFSNKDETEAEESQSKSTEVENIEKSKDDIDSIDVGVKEVVAGCALLEVCCSTQVSQVSTALLSCPALKIEDSSVQVCTISDGLKCGDDKLANEVLVNFLREKLIKENSLSDQVQQMLSEIFASSKARETDALISISSVSNNLQHFVNGCASEAGETADELVRRVWKSHGNEEGLLSEDKFVNWVCERVKLVTGEGVKAVWLGLLACGYDFHFERCGFFPFDTLSCQLTEAQDYAIVHFVDSMCRSLATTADSIEPWDISLSEAHVTSHQLSPLQGLTLKDVRMRFLQLKHLNNQLSPLFSVLDLRCTHPLSLGCLLSKTTPFLFYDRKISIFHSILNASTRRSFDQAPPEIKMDPLESVSGLANAPLSTHYCQAAEQLSSVPSAQLCIPLASGGDPTYAFNVKLSGEEVHGTSGSFRHFLWQVVRELQSSVLPVLLPCPSGATGVNHGRYILATGPMTFSEEKLLQFFGQLLGVAIRADMPIALDLLPCFWKSLKGEPLSLSDLKEADCVTYNLTARILECSSAEELEEVVTGLHHGRGVADDEGEEKRVGMGHAHLTGLKFVFTQLDGAEVVLCPGGKKRRVEYSSREEFVSGVRELRLRELECYERMQAVRCGMASVIPLELLSLLTAHDLDLRVCGLPHINLEYLKRHTMYQVGLMETDKHVQFFWHALESFSQDELRKFIKFACNQERIPFGHPCREGGKDQVLHVPPYPMKIAPPDGKGPPDSRYIRAETCMFMIKLPQYSSQVTMTERLRYAIHCREDPLSG